MEVGQLREGQSVKNPTAKCVQNNVQLLTVPCFIGTGISSWGLFKFRCGARNGSLPTLLLKVSHLDQQLVGVLGLYSSRGQRCSHGTLANDSFQLPCLLTKAGAYTACAMKL